MLVPPRCFERRHADQVKVFISSSLSTKHARAALVIQLVILNAYLRTELVVRRSKTAPMSLHRRQVDFTEATLDERRTDSTIGN